MPALGVALAAVTAAHVASAAAPQAIPPVTVASPDPVIVLPVEGRNTAYPALPAGTPVDQLTRDPATPVETLGEAMARAYWTNPQVLAQRATLRGTDYRVPQARSDYGPQLEYSLARGYVDAKTDLSPTVTLPRSGWTTTARVVIDQPLFTFGRLRAGEDAAQAQVLFGRGQLGALEQQTMLQTIAAYVGVLRDRSQVGISEAQVDLLTREFNDTAIRLEARDSTASDLQLVRSRLQVARAQLADLRSQQTASSAAFLQIVGAPAGELLPPNPLSMPVNSIEDAYVYAETHNPVIRAVYAREQVSRAQKAAAEAELLPRVSLRGERSQAPVTQYSNTLRQNETRATVTLSGSLDAGRRLARVGEAKEANDADWRLIDRAVRDNRQEIAEAWSAWEGATQAVDELVIAVDAAERAYLGGSEQQRAGLRTTTEILELARDLLTARSTLNSSRANVVIAQARVLAALGALDYRTLFPSDPAYDPVTHYDAHKRDGDIPLLTPAVRALDSLLTQPRTDRWLRDPANSTAIGTKEKGEP